MPIYEYRCRSCGREFEALVRSGEQASCPGCRSADLERLISMFAVESDGSRQLAIDAARRANARVTREKARADYEYERKHWHE